MRRHGGGGGGEGWSPTSILRNSHVSCHYFCNFYFEFNKVPYRMSNILCHIVLYSPITRLYMSHVDILRVKSPIHEATWGSGGGRWWRRGMGARDEKGKKMLKKEL